MLFGSSSVLQLIHRPLLIAAGIDVYASPFRYDPSTRAIESGLFDREYQIIGLSRRVSGQGGDRIVDKTPDAVEPDHIAEIVTEPAIYLGNLMGHYGHFITEGVSSFWALKHFPDRKAYFHPFIFGSRVYPWMRIFFEAFGMADTDVRVITSPTLFRQIIVPERSFKLNESVHLDYGEIGRRVVHFQRGALPKAASNGLLFLSRSRLAEDRRRVANHLAVEQLFSRLGFQIVHPQELSVGRQIEIYSDCAVMAGFAGSALHNCIFMDKGSLVVELGDQRSPRSPMLAQVLCALGSGCSLEYIPFVEDGAAPRACDLAHIRSSMRGILGGRL